MKRIFYKLFFLIIMLIISMLSILITFVNADSIAGLNCPSSVTTGEKITISLILPADACSAQANIKVELPDGTQSSQNLVYMEGMAQYPNSVTFDSKGAGTAKITASNIIIGKSDETYLENGGSKTASIEIKAKEEPKPQEDSKPQENPKPVEEPKPVETPKQPENNGTVEEAKFTDVNETVYATENCKIRANYNTGSTVLGKLGKNKSIKRTGIGDNGWSKVEYNGQTAYMSSKYLTTEAPPEQITIKDATGTYYATKNCNLRESPNTKAPKVEDGLDKNEEFEITGITSNGWYRLNYNGKEAYVSKSLVKAKKNDTSSTKNTVENTAISNPVENNTISNVVDNDANAVEENQLSIIKEEIGVLPEVGYNPAVIIYVIITISALIVAVIISYKNNM